MLSEHFDKFYSFRLLRTAINSTPVIGIILVIGVYA